MLELLLKLYRIIRIKPVVKSFCRVMMHTRENNGIRLSATTVKLLSSMGSMQLTIATEPLHSWNWRGKVFPPFLVSTAELIFL